MNVELTLIEHFVDPQIEMMQISIIKKVPAYPSMGSVYYIYIQTNLGSVHPFKNEAIVIP